MGHKKPDASGIIEDEEDAKKVTTERWDWDDWTNCWTTLSLYRTGNVNTNCKLQGGALT